MQTKNFFAKNKLIPAFLIFETLFLLAFNFGAVPHVFGFLGFAVTLIAFLFIFKINKVNKKLLVCIPLVVALFVTSIFTSFNGFSSSFNISQNISTLLSLPAFFVLGYLFIELKDFKVPTALYSIGIGFALLSLVSFFAVLINYGPFYSAIAEAKDLTVYYENGTMFDITNEVQMLYGFGIKEVSQNYGGLIGLIPSLFLCSLIFLSPKTNKKEFFMSLSIGGAGFLYLVVVPNLGALFVLLFITVLVFIFKYFNSSMLVLKTTAIGLLSIVSLGLLYFFIVLVNAALGFVFTGFLERLFVTNRFMTVPTEILKSIFGKNIFGINSTLQYNLTMKNSGIFEVEILKEAGLVGGLTFVLFVVGIISAMIKLLKNKSVSVFTKSLLLTIGLGFLIYESLFFVNLSLLNPTKYNAFFRQPPTLIMLFIFGLIFGLSGKEETQDEK